MNGNNNMQQKTLISISLLLFALGAVFLFWQNERELDPDQGKNWWVIAFALPKESSDLSFTIENHSDQASFRYEIAADKAVLLQETLSVNRGETLTVTPPLTAQTDTRTTITVNSGNDTKKIYR